MSERIVSHNSRSTRRTPVGQEAWDVDKLKLLIIEDDADQRELICETLEDYFGVGTTRGGPPAVPRRCSRTSASST